MKKLIAILLSCFVISAAFAQNIGGGGTVNGNTITTGTGTLTLGTGKTTTFNSTSTWSGTDGQTYTFPSTSATIARTDAAQARLGVADASQAGAGNIGEYQEVNCGIPAASGGSVAFTSASPTVGTWTSHPFAKVNAAYGSYACGFTITATAPTGLSTGTNYWAVPIDANTFHVATSAANAAAGTFANTSGSTTTSNLTNSIALSTTAGLSPALLNVTAGDWDCSGTAIRVLGASTSVTNMQTGMNTSSTAVGGLGTYNDLETAANVMTATNNPVQLAPSVRMNVSSATANYLVALDTFTVSTDTVSGSIRCRRMR